LVNVKNDSKYQGVISSKRVRLQNESRWTSIVQHHLRTIYG